MQCWGCAGTFHPPCDLQPAPGGGPYHCTGCRKEFKAAGVDDITLDDSVMRVLVMGTPPDAAAEDEKVRCKKVVAWFRWDGSKLWLVGP